MYALIKDQATEGLWLRQTKMPTLSADSVLIKVKNTGICGTDVHIWNWDEWAQEKIPLPLIIGHEFCGEVIKTGSNARQFSIGTRVSGEGHIVNMNSRAGRSGRPHLDAFANCVGVTRHGAFAQYIELPASNVVALPDHIDDELAAILDPLGNAVHCALSFDLSGENVLITGAGPIGIMAAAIARHVGADHIVITDISQTRLDIAKKTVSDCVTVNTTTQDLKSIMQTLRISEGFDIGLEMSGSSSAISQMIDSLVQGGKIASLGLPSKMINLKWSSIVTKGLLIKGVYGREIFDTWRKMFNLLEAGLNVKNVISHRLAAHQFEQGFTLLKEGKAAKVILNWN
ncbi:L-threonine 3-dehydrogenase [Pseudomonas nabeulensis]|uniref:L-threonine 3-dehydrogenase n=1 Tax=Pseudomonas nabeulensis TaxID=2293833 RepID=A0A4Z0B4Y7_9PSED|nr:L-threonine 3-dehydrogenase [Pseudomonas nabeulensis]TFY93469.1 L-threonine 3-dehydrogenase [Pseudomonas nabeulensis]